jgi:hypothetical protein
MHPQMLVMGGLPDRDFEPPLPQPEAAADTLRERLATYNEGHSFDHGELVGYKTGFDYRMGRYASQPTIFIRYILPEEAEMEGYSPIIASPGHVAMRYDCLVGYLADDGGMMFRREDSKRLKPWTPPAE